MSDELFMSRCLQLAKKGKADVAPNPMVGCVIVHEDKIIGEGYHQKFGEAHAEVNAIASVKDKSLLKTSTLYVNLEPCAHFGKTPPCCNLIIEHEIPKVVIGTVDTFAKVSGLGVRNMKLAGCEVIEDVLPDECHELNKRFFSYHTKSKPYVILKWAQSKDGFMDIDRADGKKGIHWITQPETKTLVHQWRAEESAVLVGKNTVEVDNPELTVRETAGKSPLRFVIDPSGELDLSLYKIGSQSPKTVVLQQSDIADILNEMREYDTLSVLVEGGKFTLDKFIESGLWDEARIITGEQNILSGLPSPDIAGLLQNEFYYGKDHVQILRNV